MAETMHTTRQLLYYVLHILQFIALGFNQMYLMYISLCSTGR